MRSELRVGCTELVVVVVISVVLGVLSGCAQFDRAYIAAYEWAWGDPLATTNATTQIENTEGK